jgi:protein-S-isoprenylcysteine O-methyltransferase Ste14
MDKKDTPPAQNKKIKKEKKLNKLAPLIGRLRTTGRYYLSIPLIPYCVFFVLALVLNIFIELEVFPFFIRIYCGLILFIIAGALYYLSWKTIRKYVEAVNILEVQPPLVLFEGMFRYSRNPVFIAGLFAFAGLCVLINNAWGILLIPFLVFTLNTFAFPPREYMMREEYGELYDDYAQKVGRWL